MSCSCPDWEVPCKHLAAVCYVLAEAFDDDPFGMLAWRGKGREELLAALRRLTGGRPQPEAGRPVIEMTDAPLDAAAAGFWSSALSPARLRALPPAAAAPGRPAAAQLRAAVHHGRRQRSGDPAAARVPGDDRRRDGHGRRRGDGTP